MPVRDYEVFEVLVVVCTSDWSHGKNILGGWRSVLPPEHQLVLLKHVLILREHLLIVSVPVVVDGRDRGVPLQLKVGCCGLQPLVALGGLHLLG
jgi:hypothetical protein